jgi:hypothetical protein
LNLNAAWLRPHLRPRLICVSSPMRAPQHRCCARPAATPPRPRNPPAWSPPGFGVRGPRGALKSGHSSNEAPQRPQEKARNSFTGICFKSLPHPSRDSHLSIGSSFPKRFRAKRADIWGFRIGGGGQALGRKPASKAEVLACGVADASARTWLSARIVMLVGGREAGGLWLAL